VLQCKLYSKPVGNNAVQEIAAGRVHRQAHFGAVVTDNTFTPSARELAASNGVHLLHYTDLTRLEQIVGGDPLIRRFEQNACEFALPFPDYVGDSQIVGNANRQESKDWWYLVWGLLCLLGATGLWLIIAISSSVPSRPPSRNSTATSQRRQSIKPPPSVGLRPAAAPSAGRNSSQTEVANKTSVSGDAAQVSIYTGECKSGNMVSCTNLGTYYRMGWGVTRELSRARALYKKGCDGGDGNGCSELELIGNP
jgi:hypothetical protein